ncbi:MAG: ISAzo13 family transposase [Deltaproteobacteria bacterium]|nr:ISAzo13 family transposase [Deltaproteobacteria bacterium]
MVSGTEKRWLKVLGTLNEAQARLFVAERALALGRGGISRLCHLTGMSRPTITKGAAELQRPRPVALVEGGRIRRVGGGRKRIEEVQPGVDRALTRILEETTAGDPMSLLKWTSKSTRVIAEEVTRRGFPMTGVTVARWLHDWGYSLQANVKILEGPQHPDRDAQFRYINTAVKAFMRTGDPVISVDTKKKELVGAFKNAGRTWRPTGRPRPVCTHDFPPLGEGKAIPYGTYDVAQDRALVNVGMTHDTAAFAVASIRRWWQWLGKKTYPRAARLLICADAGGSNGNRLRAWKVQLHALATEIGVPITVAHYPPGTSKWNKIEHRLFSFISMNWKGTPLVSYATVVNLIGHTRTRSGLRVKALLDTRAYAVGTKISAGAMRDLQLTPHAFHPEWNYTLAPPPAHARTRTKRQL